MKNRILPAILFSFALCLLPACEKSKPVLHVYTWADYIKPELVQRFEQENACQVVIDTFDSNESMYAKLKAGGTGYDILTPSSYMVRIMNEQGMLQALKRALLPNLKNVDADYLKVAIDPDMHHSVPYMITYVGIGYLSDRVTDMKPSWTMLDREDLKGRMTMLNDMRETVGAALKSLGYSLNSTDDKELEEAKNVVLRWKRQLAKFESEQYKTGLASGEFLLTHGYSGDILKVKEENDKVEFVIPEEGFSLAVDDLVIPTDAKQVELAHRFINFLHDPKVAAENTEFITYLCPNRASYALLSEEIKSDPGIFPPEEIRKKGEIIKDLGLDNQKYTRVWDQIKAAE
jgi:spermidine/putrescine transport system substrate-binding protein